MRGGGFRNRKGMSKRVGSSNSSKGVDGRKREVG